MSKDKKSIILFYSITIAVSAVFETLYIISKTSMWLFLLMWTPGITGIVCSQIFYRKERTLGILKKLKIRYIFIGIFLPVLYLGMSYIITWGILKDSTIGTDGLVHMYIGKYNVNGVLFLILFFFPGLIGSCITAAGEELGWRGFAYPILERILGSQKAVLVNGVIWGLWHFPLIIFGVYESKTTLAYGLINFTVCIMLMTVVFCWIRSASGSVIPAILLHASHNFMDQTYLQPLSTNPKVPYFAGEQGCITIIMIGLIAVLSVLNWKKHILTEQKLK